MGDNVDDLRCTANQIDTRVHQLDGRMQEVAGGVQSANYGIMLLCQAVHEVTHRVGMHNSRSSQALKTYVTSPVLTAAAGPAPAQVGTSGLRGLILEGSSGEGAILSDDPSLLSLPAPMSALTPQGSEDASTPSSSTEVPVTARIATASSLPVVGSKPAPPAKVEASGSSRGFGALLGF